ncbi:MAG TPA: RDD family protein [Myxococcota bacterium]|nr:RDD family protein [Myxococcota bacterium]
MSTPSIFRVIFKDVADFSIVIVISFLFTMAIYQMLPSFTRVELSFYFPEQYVELFYLNPKLVLWFLGLSFGVTFIYFLFGVMLCGSTLGGRVAGIVLLKQKELTPASLIQALLMALGAYLGVLFIMVGPLSAWWLDPLHRGWSEKLAGVVLVKRRP